MDFLSEQLAGRRAAGSTTGQEGGRKQQPTQCSCKTEDKFATASMAKKLLDGCTGAHARVVDIYIYVYAYAYIYILCICTYICICIYIYISMYICMCMCMYVYMCLCMHVYIYICTRVHVYVYVYIRVHMHFCREYACIHRCC